MLGISSLAMKQNTANSCTSTSSATSAFFSISFYHDTCCRSSSLTDCLCSSELPCSDITTFLKRVPGVLTYFTAFPVCICFLQRQQISPSPSLTANHHTPVLGQSTVLSSIHSCLKTCGFDGNCLLTSLEDRNLQAFLAQST